MTEIQNYYYYQGNTVRVDNTVPLYAPSQQQAQSASPYRYQNVSTAMNRPLRNLPTREQRERERRAEEEARAKKAHRKHVANLRAHRLTTFSMIIAAFLACGLFVGYVSLQNDITTRRKHISSLENQISVLKADNSVAQSRIATSTNLSDIKNSALTELGMVYATSAQIVYYSMDTEDYMSQYKDIPKGKRY
ncbi:MAG: hypothetical protein HUJ75_08240 [Parasporobacterium sp.]|nr:hypothetical protein [Parasporobacterium sp.]